MARASDVSITLNTQAVPLYPGSADLAAQGIRSSLWQANRDMLSGGIPDTAHATLMFDPQTAGGLLAALPPSQAEAAKIEIEQMGHTAAIIGDVGVKTSDALTLI